MPHGQPSDRPSDRRNEHCFAYQRYSWKPTAAGTGGRADGPTIARRPPPETLFHSPDKLIRRPRSAVAALFPLPSHYSALQRRQKRSTDGSTFPVSASAPHTTHNTSTLRQVQCSFNDSFTLESGERQISQPRVKISAELGTSGHLAQSLRLWVDNM